MPRPSKGLNRENTLRTTDTERLVLEHEQQWYDLNGLTLSLNDVMRSLIRRAKIPIPMTMEHATEAVTRHSEECSECGAADELPQCPDGLYIRQFYAHFLAVRAAPPASGEPAARRTVNGRRPLLPPPPGKVQS